MLRINTLSLCALAVLLLGLSSCAKQEEKTKQDSYRAPAPRILRAGQNIDLAAWDRTSQRTLDIQDALDVRNSGSTGVKITSRCRRGDFDFTYSLSTSELEPIALYKTLDRNLLSEDLNQLPASCTFEVALINGNGSRHIFAVPQSVLRDEQPALVGFERDGEKLNQQRNRFVVGKLAGVIYRFQATGNARVLCQDAQDTARSFEEVGRLEEHSLNAMIVKPGRAADVLQMKSIQICRLLISQNGSDSALSPLFELQLARAPLIIRPQLLNNRNGAMSRVEIASDPSAAALVEGRPWEAAQYVIENRLEVERLVKLPRTSLEIKILAKVSSNSGAFDVNTINRRILAVEPKDNGEDKGDHYLLRIPPKGTVVLSAIVRVPGRILCQRPIVLIGRGLAIDFPSFSVEEINDKGEALAQLTSDLGPRAYLGSTAAEFNAVSAMPAANICNW